jgi:hypothetical protein
MAALVRLAPALALVACRDEPTSATAPFSIEASLSAELDNTVGTIVTPAPTFVVRNSLGHVLANVPVSVSVTTGDGTLRNVPLRTGTGSTSIGEWTLDTIAGTNEITIVAGSAPPVKVTVIGRADAPASVVADAGTLDGLAGDFLSGLFALRVRDRYGNPVSGAGIDLAVSKGGGEVSPPSLMTDGNGIASGIAWRLGRLGGSQQLNATVGSLHAEIAASIRSAFDPVVRVYGSAVPGNLAAALTTAVDRLHAAIVGEVGDVPILNFDMSRCGLQGVTLNETVDDLIIFALVTPIDGVGKILASAGPCVLRTQSRYPVIGIMRFDADDIDALAGNGRLPAVVLHEMLHVIGIGTLWRTRDMVFGSGTTDPRFIGSLAGAQCISAGGFTGCSDGRVPVENVGGSGTLEVHWRESVFDREVMTGFVEANDDMPFSSMSLASLQDLGYVANLLSADPYTVPTPGTVSPRLSPQLLAPWESLTLPVFEVTPSGWIRPIVLR